jgi:hypothetical protein
MRGANTFCSCKPRNRNDTALCRDTGELLRILGRLFFDCRFAYCNSSPIRAACSVKHFHRGLDVQFLKTTCGVILLLLAFLMILGALGAFPASPGTPLRKPPADFAEAAGRFTGNFIAPMVLAFGGYWLVRRRKPK